MAKKFKQDVPFKHILSALLDTNKPIPESYLFQFSDLDRSDLDSLREVWLQINPDRRVALIQQLAELTETDTLAWFIETAIFALDDPDPRVRRTAIPMLWESDDKKIPPILIRMLDSDPDVEVRAAAASALGSYVYQGELEELPVEILHAVEDALLQAMNSQDDQQVRRRALEAMGFSGRPEVPDLIRAAYQSGIQDMLVSALFAMGRSADPAWGPDVTRMLKNPKMDIQLEAVRAAGELGLETARVPLLRILEEEDQDPDLRDEAIWALSKIGGEDVRDAFEQLFEETEDEDLEDLLEDALDNLAFTEDTDLFSLLNLDEEAGEENLEEEDVTSLEELIASEVVDEEEEEEDIVDDEDFISPKPPAREPPPSSGSLKKKKPYRHH